MNVIHSKVNHSVVCELCSKEFGTKSYLRGHIKGHHRQGSTKFNCTLCGAGRYNQEKTLQKHILKCHSGLSYKCEFCDKTFSSPIARRPHIRENHKEKTLSCSECDKKFVLQSLLMVHFNHIHQKLRKMSTCPHCSEEFEAYSSAFKAHVNRHTDNRQFACETCGKSFLVERHLKEHMKRHTLSYFCDKCKLRLGSTNLLRRHTRIVHEQIQIQCRHGCGWSCWGCSCCR